LESEGERLNFNEFVFVKVYTHKKTPPTVTAASNWQRDALIKAGRDPCWFKAGGHQLESNLHLKMHNREDLHYIP